MILENDRVPLCRVCYLLNTPRAVLVPLLSRLAVPIEFDPLSADVWVSRTALGAALRTAAL